MPDEPAGWERDWASDHLEPFLWVVAGASTMCSLAVVSTLEGWKERERV
jgi:hypothetical protein